MERYNKYLVIKTEDVQKLSGYLQERLETVIDEIRSIRFREGKKDQSYVCVAADWPMYEQVWSMAEAFVDGKPNEIDILKEQLAVAQADNARLREVLEPFGLVSTEGVVKQASGHVEIITCVEYFHRAAQALSTPSDTSALDAMIKKAKEEARLAYEQEHCRHTVPLPDALNALIEQAKAEEREACAITCFDMADSVVKANRMISAVIAMEECGQAIRARGEK